MRLNLQVALFALSTLSLVLSGCGDAEITQGEPNQDNGQQNNTNDNTNDNKNNDPNDNNDNQNGDAEFYDEASDLAAAHCERVFACCSADEQGYDSEDDCKTGAIGSLFGLTSEELEDSYGDGRIEVDEGAVSTCVDTIDDLSCSAFDGTRQQRQRLEGCDDIITPRVEADGVCDRDWECTTDACSSDGTCIELAEQGESCSDIRCTDGYYCDSEDQCVAQKQEGQECNHDDHCESGHCIPEDPDSDIVTEAYCEESAPRCEG